MRDLRRKGLALTIILSLLVAFAAYADTFLLDYSGFDWVEWGAFGNPGTCYTAQGYVPAVNPTYINADYGVHEYTFLLDYSCQVSKQVFGTTAVYTYAASTFDVYCDSLATGTAATFGTNPVWPASTTTFVDGECILGADFTGDLVFVVNTSTGNGNLQGNVDWVRGTQLGNIPVSQRSMSLTLAGLVHDGANVFVPQGYEWQIDGQVFIQDPVPTEKTSWGQLKHSFTEGI